MRNVVACAIAVCLLSTLSSIAGEADPKRAVTDLSQVDADYHIQGEYSGIIPFSDGLNRKVGLQVIALGHGKFDGLWYQGGLPGNGFDGTARRKLNGVRIDSKVELLCEGLVVELQAGTDAIVKSSAGRTLGSLRRKERHSVTEGAIPPANAIVLFDGKNVDQWKNARITPDGLLQVGTETKMNVQNFTLHAEFRTPYMPYEQGQRRGNSGFYLQKRYEVQVLDSFGREPQFDYCAALYRQKAPDLNMSFQPLHWQTYDIDFTAPKFDADGKRIAKGRITIRHNGVVVHCDREIENKTGAGDVEGPKPQPILLQQHGDPVNFRNIWLVSHDSMPTTAPAASSAVAATTGPCQVTSECCCVPRRACRHRRCR